jgi:hypothetical protein
VFLQGAFNMLSYYNTREKLFKSISTASVLRASSRTAAQIGVGFISKTPAGLIIGQMLGHFVRCFHFLQK